MTVNESRSCQADLSRRDWLGRALVAAGWVALPVPLTGLASQQHRVVISSLMFAPAQISVKAGDRVTWLNDDIVPHTATASDHRWDTGIIEPGQQVTLQIPEGDVTADYYCLYHPLMKGSIR